MKTTRTVSMRALTAAFLFTTLASTSALAQEPGRRDDDDDDSKKPLPLKADRKATFTATEATWMSPDVSPDGQTISVDWL
ncbi:MAG: hypothetical protein IIA27_06455, partial [Gemmatimonadetes bacterium]|nr:hypothetical protein [Gemmatimonadota bacterium]